MLGLGVENLRWGPVSVQLAGIGCCECWQQCKQAQIGWTGE